MPEALEALASPWQLIAAGVKRQQQKKWKTKAMPGQARLGRQLPSAGGAG